MTTQTVWLIFRETKLPLLRFLRKPFGHVIGITRDDFNWLVVDPMHFRLRSFILDYPAKENLPDIIKRHEKNVRILKIVIDDTYEPVHIFRLSLFTCVSVMKYYLGVRLFAFTPYRLYKKLLKMQNGGNRPAPIISVEHIKGDDDGR